MDSSVQAKASVPSYYRLPQDLKVIVYRLQVSLGMNHWELEKRYSHFDSLHDELKPLFGNTLPSLPKKTFTSFFLQKTDQDIDNRREGLDEYLKNLVSRSDILNSEPVKIFLELEKNAKQQIVNPPQLVAQFNDFLYGIRDIFIQPKDGLMIVVVGDMNIASRLDAYLTNMKFPWEEDEIQQQTAIAPVGAVELWVPNTEGGELLRQWVKLYQSQAICCHWENTTNTLLVGLDNGQVNLLKVLKENGEYKQYSESMDIDMHFERVMGVYYEAKRTLIHSVSKDRRYRVLDLGDSQLRADYEPSQFELTGLIVNEERKKSFVSDRCGSIFIFDIEQVQEQQKFYFRLIQAKPVPFLHLQTTMKSVRGMHLDSTRNYLFAVGYEEGEIYVYDIEKPGKEKFTKQTAKLINKEKVKNIKQHVYCNQSREIKWSRKRGEIYVGNADGTITIWDAKIAQPIYVLAAHSSEVTKIIWLEEDQTLITGGKDKFIKIWKLPTHWRAEQSKEEQKQALQNLIQKQNKQIEKSGSIEEDDDDLVKWHK